MWTGKSKKSRKLKFPASAFSGGEVFGQRRDHVSVVEDTGAFTDAVHGPHRVADIDARDAEAGGNDGADGAAAAEVGTVGVLLAGHLGAAAERHETGGGVGAGAVALVSVGLDDGPAIDQCPVARFVSGGEVGVPAVRHIGADEKAVGQHAALVFAVQALRGGEPGDDVLDETAAGAGGAFATDFFVVKEGDHRGWCSVAGSQQ